MAPDHLFNNKYRTQTTRLQGWDYSSSGWYFITVCTRYHEIYFGEIKNDEMHLSELGHIAAGNWLGMARVYDILIMDAWIIMPNHFHCLIGIDNPNRSAYQPNEFKKMVKNSVSSVINHFKGRVTKHAKKENIPFQWQSRFYDHLVRDDEEFKRIQNYINNNPKNWDTDKFYRI
jgi:REP element-mobilizing transposase RayT